MKEQFKTSIGGQAVIEGVMMRGPLESALAVRKPDASIELEKWENPPAKFYQKIPFLRGVFNMISSMLLGYKCLMRSAEIAGMEEEEPSKFETWVSNKTGANIMSIASVISLLLGVGVAVLLFVVLPTALGGFVYRYYPSPLGRSIIEGVTKIAIFIGYLALVSKMPDIKRVFQYHGAEHKTIACYEAGLPLTVENVKPQKRLHPRCGTSFLLIVLVISIIVFTIVQIPGTWLRMVMKILLLPVVVGISYEIIRLAGRYNNPFTRIISAPGLWLQHLTTKEPDETQIEVAIASMQPVIPNEKGLDEW